MAESSTDLLSDDSNENKDALEQENRSMDELQIEEGQINLSDDAIAKGDTEQTGYDVKLCKIVPLPNARSEVWAYFGFIADQEGAILDRSEVICRLCKSAFRYSGNTTNFYSHLNSLHGEIQVHPNSGQSSRSSLKRTYASMNDEPNESEYLNDTRFSTVNKSVSQGDSRLLVDEETIRNGASSDLIHVDDITASIVDFLISDCRPLSLTQGKGFQRMLHLLAPGYSLPDKAHLALEVGKKYDQMCKEAELGLNTFDD